MTDFERIEKFAWDQTHKANDTGTTDDCIGFDFYGVFIINPWTSENTLKEFTTDEAIEYYGVENMYRYGKEVLARLNDTK